MHFLADARGAEMSEVIAGLVAVLAAGIVAINVAMGGLQGGATKIKNWLTATPAPAARRRRGAGVTIAAPKTS